MFGWVPRGSGIPAWVGSRVWLVPDDEPADAWLLEDAESLGQRAGTDSLVLTGLDDYEGRRKDTESASASTTGIAGWAPARNSLGSWRPSRKLRLLYCGGSRRAIS
ncbi:hypothetical protein K377_08046 [Streptomyces sp. PsTaAH-137]|nr:hypothetical protein K377_08046 [Streptomyces sp. PsTaAH-137]